MSKSRKNAPEEERSAAEYYQLHSSAIDDLVHADAENSPEVTPEELAKYRSHRAFSLSEWLKVLLIKFWFNGSVCFFFFWGLGAYLADLPDQLLVLGIAMGVITDLLVNNILRYYAPAEGENDRWMMFPKKRFSSLPLNILYAFWVLFFVLMLYNLINSILASVRGTEGGAVLGVGPILFGLFYLGFDLLFLALKQLFLRILHDAQDGANRRKG